MIFETFSTTIVHPFTDEPLSVEVTYRLLDVGGTPIYMIDSVIGDQREWVAELDEDDFEALQIKASRHHHVRQNIESDMFDVPDYGE
jgi:hypothetical protein